MGNYWIGLGAILGFLSVALGAFATHALRDTLAPRSFEIFQTAAHYQMMHALALFALGIWLRTPNVAAPGPAAGWAFTIGIALFCGSLYALALTGARWLGAVAPLGGLAFMLGWILVAIAAWRSR